MDNINSFRILIIDDNAEIHKDFKKILLKKTNTELENLERLIFKDDIIPETLPEFIIDSAMQGQEGLLSIEQSIKEARPYSLAFVDIRMPPGWDGIETIKKIWLIDKDIHIVICTAYSDYSWEETIDSLGYNNSFLILKKPFDHIVVRQLAFTLTKKWKLTQDSRNYTQFLEGAIEKRTEELKYQANHDALTGLANRSLLYEKIELAIQSSKQNQQYFAIFFIDLDRFKLVNDSLGHTRGDELLKIVTQRLLPFLKDTDTFSRLGGDEFVFIITEFVNQPVSITASHILKSIKKSLTIDKCNITISASMGIVLYPQDGREADELLRNADAAMYHAKRSGGDQFQFYSKDMNENVLEQLKLESQLYNALENNEFSLWYQPQFNLLTNKIDAVEALLRWNHPEEGLLLPHSFISLAECTGLIIPIGEWVIKQACLQHKKWEKMGLGAIRIAVNVAAQQLNQFNFVQKVKDILKETQLQSKYLEIELTESSIINDISRKKLNELNAFGIEIALDDFGTGYSNLYHLKNISLNRVKID